MSIDKIALAARHATEFGSLRVDEVRWPDGREGTYTVFEPTNAYGAVIIPRYTRGSVSLLGLTHQFRYPIQRLSAEFPRGGTLDLSETEAARELHEEMGVKPLAMKRLGTLHPDTAAMPTEVGVWLAETDEPLADHIDGETGAAVEWVEQNALFGRAAAGKITCGMTLAALGLFKVSTHVVLPSHV